MKIKHVNVTTLLNFIGESTVLFGYGFLGVFISVLLYSVSLGGMFAPTIFWLFWGEIILQVSILTVFAFIAGIGVCFFDLGTKAGRIIIFILSFWIPVHIVWLRGW